MASPASSRSLALLELAQAAWARRSRLPLQRPGYLAALPDNLFLRQLHPETESEFRKGDGAELTDVGRRPAKMRALLSSSALAVNFFDAWRHTPRDALTQALALPAPITDLQFEYKCRHYPVGPRSPNLDVLLTLGDGRRVGVECKFAEPYHAPTGALSSKYFTAGDLWSRVGLEGAQRLAEELRPHWRFLDAAQLLKHLLGLAHDADAGQSILLYLWYDVGTPDADIHRREVARFAENLTTDRVIFRSMTYQDLFGRVRSLAAGGHDKWLDYLATRYFPTSETV